MPLPSNNEPDLRRSARASVPTKRAQQYLERHELETPLFPAAKEEIVVKWLLHDRFVWWPATVLSIEEQKSDRNHCVGVLLYHQYMEYSAERTSVLFSVSTPDSSRLVRSLCLGGRISENASWAYAYTLDSDDNRDENSERQADSERDEIIEVKKNRLSVNRSSVNDGTDAIPSSSANHTAHGSPITPNSRKLRPSVTTKKVTDHSSPRATINKLRRRAKRSARTKQVEKDDESNKSSGDDGHHSSIAQRDETGEERAVSQPISNVGQSSDFGIRLSLLERQLQDVTKEKSTGLSSTAQSVIVSLRWAFLRALEKPLKNFQLPGLSTDGFAFQEISITAQCDYFTFKELAATLAKEHNCSAAKMTKSRIAFSPCFSTTQSGSNAADNMNILFSCLADLATFLRIRDDNDFETILSKEVVTPAVTMLRIIGTFEIDDNDDGNDGSNCNDGSTVLTQTRSTESISASSDRSRTVRLFVGSSPVQFVVGGGSNTGNSSQHEVLASAFQTTVISQECRYFCSMQKCYRTQWKPLQVSSNLFVDCFFDLDGTVSKEQQSSYFRLNWTRQAAPSSVKWTRDVQDVSNNSPGIIRLSVPSVYFSANRNVLSIVSILDDHIETFMNLRSKIHNLSSFK